MFNTDKKIQIRFKIVLLLTLFSAFTFLSLIGVYWYKDYQNENKAVSKAERQAKQATETINNELGQFAKIGNDLAEALDTSQLRYENIPSRIKDELENNEKLLGIGVVFKPYRYKNNQRLYAPYFIRNQHLILDRQIDKLYDYTAPKGNNSKLPMTDWYLLPIENNLKMWIDPFFGSASQDLLTVYSVPFYVPNRAHTPENQMGVVICTVSLAKLDRLVAAMDLGSTGYGYVISQQGTIIAHPVKEFLGKKELLIQTNQAGQEGTFQKVADRESWHFILPLSSVNWSIGMILKKEDFSITPKEKMYRVSWIILMGVLTCLFLSVLVTRAYLGTNKRLWISSCGSALFFAFGIALLWYFHLALIEPFAGTPVLDKATLNRYLLLNMSPQKQSTLIPTGVFIHSVYFGATNLIGINGILWQKFPDTAPEPDVPDVVFTQQAQFMQSKKISHKKIGNENLVLWHFNITVRQSINPVLFPLEKINLSIGLIPGSFINNTVLIPDLDGYKVPEKSPLIGLYQNTYLESWRIQKSFFSYQVFNHETFFGEKAVNSGQTTLELQFNIIAVQRIVNAIFTYMIPLLFVILMLFAFVTNNDSSNLVGYSGAMLIVLTVAQAGLRDKIAVQGISYLEIFYIVMYPLMVLFVVCFLLRKSSYKISFFQFRDGIVPKLLFWPLILGIDFICSLIFLNCY